MKCYYTLPCEDQQDCKHCHLTETECAWHETNHNQVYAERAVLMSLILTGCKHPDPPTTAGVMDNETQR